jgi:integrase
MRGTIKKRAKNSWTLWWDEPRGAGGKRRQRNKAVTGPKRVAEAELRMILAELDSGSYIPPNKVTVKDLLVRWLSEYVDIQVRPNTADGYRMICELHIVPALGILRLDELHPSHVMSYQKSALVNGRRDGKGGLSAQTVKHHHRVLSQALEYGVGQGLLSRNVCKAVKAPRPAYKEMKVLTVEQIARLFETARSTPYFRLIHLALYTGLRRSELLGLRWKDTDLVSSVIHVTQGLNMLRNKRPVFAPPKTPKSRRSVALSPVAVEALEQHHAEREVVCESLGAAISGDDLVFGDVYGNPLSPSTVSHAFGDICRKIGISGIRFHDLRHTHATLLMKQVLVPRWFRRGWGTVVSR